MSKFKDVLTDVYFKKGESEKTVFYPWGSFGDGFILDPKDALKAREKMKLYTGIGVLGVGGSILTKMYVLVFGVFLVVSLVYAVWVMNFTYKKERVRDEA